MKSDIKVEEHVLRARNVRVEQQCFNFILEQGQQRVSEDTRHSFFVGIVLRLQAIELQALQIFLPRSGRFNEHLLQSLESKRPY